MGDDLGFPVCPLLITVTSVHVSDKVHPGRAIGCQLSASILPLMSASPAPERATLGVEPRGEGASTNLGRMRRKKPGDEASHGCFVDGEDVGNRKVIQNGLIDDGWDIK